MRYVLDIKKPGEDFGFAMKEFPELDHVPADGCSIFPEVRDESEDPVLATVIEALYMLTDGEILIVCELADGEDVAAFNEKKGWRLNVR